MPVNFPHSTLMLHRNASHPGASSSQEEPTSLLQFSNRTLLTSNSYSPLQHCPAARPSSYRQAKVKILRFGLTFGTQPKHTTCCMLLFRRCWILAEPCSLRVRLSPSTNKEVPRFPCPKIEQGSDILRIDRASPPTEALRHLFFRERVTAERPQD